MAFDYELALQVFEKMDKQERAALFEAMNFLMAVEGTTLDKDGKKKKEVVGLVATKCSYAQVDKNLDGHLRVSVVVPSGSLYGLSIEDPKQKSIAFKTLMETIEETPLRKPRDIL